jgi:two-component system alkaline phosphatase synthesis response regulator PhoP
MDSPLILVAEDERDIRELIVITLQTHGLINVIQAANGEEAVAKARECKPALILMDVRMPRMTGYEACEVLKIDATTRDIPIIFLSAKGQDSEIKRGIELGAQEYVLKPFGPEELFGRVAGLLRQSGYPIDPSG